MEKTPPTKSKVHKGTVKMNSASGTLKEKLKSSSYSVGDAIEEVGKKLQRKGYPKIGQGIEKIGNTIEHFAD